MPLTPEEENELKALEQRYGNSASNALTPEEEQELALLDRKYGNSINESNSSNGNLISSATHVLGQIGEGAINVGKGLYDLGSEVYNNMNDPENRRMAMEKEVFPGTGAVMSMFPLKSIEEDPAKFARNTVDMIGYTASQAVPIIGPTVYREANQLLGNEEDIPAVDTLSQEAGSFLVPKAISKVAQLTGKGINRFVGQPASKDYNYAMRSDSVASNLGAPKTTSGLEVSKYSNLQDPHTSGLVLKENLTSGMNVDYKGSPIAAETNYQNFGARIQDRLSRIGSLKDAILGRIDDLSTKDNKINLSDNVLNIAKKENIRPINRLTKQPFNYEGQPLSGLEANGLLTEIDNLIEAKKGYQLNIQDPAQVQKTRMEISDLQSAAGDIRGKIRAYTKQILPSIAEDAQLRDYLSQPEITDYNYTQKVSSAHPESALDEIGKNGVLSSDISDAWANLNDRYSALKPYDALNQRFAAEIAQPISSSLTHKAPRSEGVMATVQSVADPLLDPVRTVPLLNAGGDAVKRQQQIMSYRTGQIPAPIWRNTERLVLDPVQSARLDNILIAAGLFAGRFETLPPVMQKKAVENAIRVAPGEFESPALGYRSYLDGKISDPTDIEMHEKYLTSSIKDPVELAKARTEFRNSLEVKGNNLNYTPVEAPKQNLDLDGFNSMFSGIDIPQSSNVPQHNTEMQMMINAIKNNENSIDTKNSGF